MKKLTNNDRDLMVNGSGYLDPTAYSAIKNAENEVVRGEDYARFYKFLETIFNICELSGYHLEGRIEVKDKKTGKIWR